MPNAFLSWNGFLHTLVSNASGGWCIFVELSLPSILQITSQGRFHLNIPAHVKANVAAVTVTVKGISY
jgi:hypothetical protein